MAVVPSGGAHGMGTEYLEWEWNTLEWECDICVGGCVHTAISVNEITQNVQRLQQHILIKILE